MCGTARWEERPRSRLSAVYWFSGPASASSQPAPQQHAPAVSMVEPGRSSWILVNEATQGRRRVGPILVVRTDDGHVVKAADKDGAGAWQFASDDPKGPFL